MNRLMILISFAFCGVLSHASDPAAAKLIEKAISRAQVLPAAYELEMKSSGFGQEGDLHIKSTNVFKDMQHLRMSFDMKMIRGGQKMEVAGLLVANGDILWMEQKVPAQGMHMVAKANVADLPKMTQGMSPEEFNPDRLLRAINKLDLKTDKQEGVFTLLTGKMNQEFLQTMPGFENMTDVLDLPVVVKVHTKNSFPFSMTIEETATQNYTFTIFSVSEPDAEALKKALSFTPPEGVQVMDMTARQ